MSLQDRLILSHLKRTHSNLNEESYYDRTFSKKTSITENPNFKKWFGNSKVTHNGKVGGKPLRVYHATNAPELFNVFKKGSYGAIFFADRPSTLSSMSFYTGDNLERELKWDGESEDFGKPRTIPVYLKMENPFDVDDPKCIKNIRPLIVKMYGEDNADEYLEYIEAGQYDAMEDDSQQFVKGIQKLGYDGFTTYEGDGKNYAVFSPTQIKSAIGNNGNFDPNNPNINESISHEEIVYDKLYKIDDNTRIEFDNVMEDVWSFSLINIDGKKEIGKIYKVSDKEYIARASNVPDIEVQGKTMIDSALELCAMLGEI